MSCRMGDTGSAQRALPQRIPLYPKVINHVVPGSEAGSKSKIKDHKSKIVNAPGFTLIELLVVISIIALLMAILTSTLARVRNQARAVACQANLRQWSILVSAHSFANPEIPLLVPDPHDRPDSLPEPDQTVLAAYGCPVVWEHRYGPQVRKLLLCPMASRPSTSNVWSWKSYRLGEGSTFFAWWVIPPSTMLEGRTQTGSYGFNEHVVGGGRPAWALGSGAPDRVWLSPDVRGATSIPLFFDTTCPIAWPPDSYVGPPAYEDSREINSHIFINRHDGRVDYLFLDWSVRKVGLKELLSLRWTPRWPMDNPWTKAGGVAPEDWPPWMRKFKDY